MTENDGPPPDGESVDPQGPPYFGENLCPDCSGSGTVDGRQCRTCRGSGKVQEPIGGE